MKLLACVTVTIWLSVVGLLLTRAAPGRPFVGTWKSANGPLLNFQGNGRFLISFGQFGAQAGQWRDMGDHTISAQVDGYPHADLSTWQVSEDGKVLVLTCPAKSETVAYLRQ